MIITGILTKAFIACGVITAIFFYGYSKGKIATKYKQLKTNLRNAAESKKRQANRRNDNIATVRKRMRKYIRR